MIRMNLDQFAGVDRRGIAEDGSGEFLPVACSPELHEISALADVQPDIGAESAAAEWAKEIAKPDEEFLITFKPRFSIRDELLMGISVCACT